MKQELTFRIILEKPPAGADFGLQKGRGSNYETVQTQRSEAADLCFEFRAGIKEDSDSTPVFGGPFVQGPPGGRFVYIDIGTYAGQAGTDWSRRLKIPLNGITRDMIHQLPANPQMVLETRVAGTGKDGGPACGTAKPFNGWKPASR